LGKKKLEIEKEIIGQLFPVIGEVIGLTGDEFGIHGSLDLTCGD